MSRRLCLAFVAAGALPAPASAGAAGPCTKVAAPSGSDAAAGTVDAPLRTAQAVIDTLHPGDTGCLRAGIYDDEVRGPYVANFTRAGSRGARITLRSYPGERARLRGVTIVHEGADHVTIAELDIDGSLPSMTDPRIGISVLAHDTVLRNNDITDRSSSCLALGSNGGWGTAIKPVVRGNRFHDCGTPDSGMLEHAIYGIDVRGGRIVDNAMVRTDGYAVHLYGRNRGLQIARNVIARNGGGVIFSGYGDHVSSRNRVTRNVITDSMRRGAITAWWDGRVGTDNRATRNCLARNRWDSNAGNPGFRASRNVAGAPSFHAPNDLGLGSGGGACLRVVGYDTVARLAATAGRASPQRG